VVAHLGAIELQSKLLQGKRSGLTVFRGIGEITWPQTVTLLDLLVNLFWTGTTYDERWRFVADFAEDFPPIEDGEMSAYHSRYGGMCMLSWLLNDWGRGRGPMVSRKLLSRWLEGSQPQASRFAGIRAPVTGSAASTLWETPETNLRTILIAACGVDAHASFFPRSTSSIHD
jgi:hypothetical protein